MAALASMRGGESHPLAPDAIRVVHWNVQWGKDAGAGGEDHAAGPPGSPCPGEPRSRPREASSVAAEP